MSNTKNPLTREVVNDSTLKTMEGERATLFGESRQEQWSTVTRTSAKFKSLSLLGTALDGPRDYAIRIFQSPFGSEVKLYFSVRSNCVHFAYIADEDDTFTITSNEIKQMVNEDYSRSAQLTARRALHVVDNHAWSAFINQLQWVIGSVHVDPSAPIELDLTPAAAA